MMFLDIPLRYLFSRSGRNRSRNARIFLGLTLSVTVLLTVISVMEYLQNNRFEYIKRVRSFPLTIECESYEEALSVAEDYSAEAYSFVYRTGEGLVNAGNIDAALNIRYIGDDYAGGLYTSGKLEDGILLPYVMVRGNAITDATVTTLEKGRVARFTQKSRTYPLDGYYSTSLGSEFDSQMIFLPLSAAPAEAPSVAAFLVPPEHEAGLLSLLEADGRGTIVTWQEREGSLYGAMQLEKIVMQLLLSSLFLIIMVQSVQNASSLAKAKKRESVALLLCGMERGKIVALFTLSAVLLVLSSVLCGTLLALCVLRLIPVLISSFRAVTFSLPLDLTLSTLILLILFSSLIYSLSSRGTIKESDIREVISSV